MINKSSGPSSIRSLFNISEHSSYVAKEVTKSIWERFRANLTSSLLWVLRGKDLFKNYIHTAYQSIWHIGRMRYWDRKRAVPLCLEIDLMLTAKPYCSLVGHNPTGHPHQTKLLWGDRVGPKKKKKDQCETYKIPNTYEWCTFLYQLRLYPHSSLPTLLNRFTRIITQLPPLSDSTQSRVNSHFLRSSPKFPNQSLNPVVDTS